jgi:hypothetical protein
VVISTGEHVHKNVSTMRTPAELVAELNCHRLLEGGAQWKSYGRLIAVSDTHSITLPAHSKDAVAKLTILMEQGYVPIGYHFLYQRCLQGAYEYTTRYEALCDHEGHWARVWLFMYDMDFLEAMTGADWRRLPLKTA